jgi:hypothetical protein
MAINFTDSPADGATQVIGGRTYTYNSAKNKWDTTATEVVGPTATVYATVDNLPGTATTGDQAFVSGTNRLYIWNGSGWYNIALINTNPSISGVSSSYDLATDGTATTVTITATDPEGLPITYSIASDTSGNIATVTQGTGASSNVFTITPSTNTANAGTFSLTFRASDGVNLATAPASFTLQFRVENSNYTTALITSVGANNAVNNTFVDSSTNSHTITAAGNATQTTFSPYRHGGYSTYFDGSSSLSVTNTGSTLAFGTGDVTVEGWLNQSLAVGTQYAILADLNVSGVGPVAFWYNGTVGTGAEFRLGAADVTQMIGFRADTPINEWFHFAYVRESGTWKFYLNGTEITTRNTDVGDADGYSFASFNPNVGSFSNGLNMAGYMADLRVVVGTAVYTTNFTPPTERLTAITNTSLLTCHLPYIADGSTNGHSITVNGDPTIEPFAPYDYEAYSASTNGGSMYFDGSGDYLSLPSSTSSLYLSGAFTYECWIYPASTGGNLIYGNWNAQTGNAWGFFYHTTGAFSNGFKVYFYRGNYGTNEAAIGSTTGLILNNWNHFAVTRDSNNNIYMFINGQSLSLTTYGANGLTWDSSYSFTNSDAIGIGGTSGYSSFNGNITNARFVSGTALYTSDFTPPTAPLTAITNTQLLVSGTNAGIIDKSQSVRTLTLTGDVKSSTTQTKYLTSSMYFDGTGDYISTPNEFFNFGTEDFTVECWFYANSLDATNYTCLFGVHNGNPNEWGTYVRTVGVGIYGASNTLPEGGTVNTSTWYHFAVTRSGTTVKVFLDGTQVATQTTSNPYSSSASPFRIGADTVANLDFNGYMSDVRITKGLARYTANFTPPTEALKG